MIVNGTEMEFTWDDLGIAATLTVLKEATDGLWGEVTFRTATDQHLLQRRFNLMASRSRLEIVRELQRRGAGIKWDDLLEQLCAMTLQERRRPPEIVDLSSVTVKDDDLFVDDHGLIAAGGLTFFYGTGESMKSMTALGLIAALSANVSLAGIRRSPGWPKDIIPMYLDWEDRRQIHAGRLRAIARGLEITVPPMPYARLESPLADAAHWLRPLVSKRGVNLLVADSFIPAAGYEPEGSDAAQRLAGALRSLGEHVSAVVISHLAKTEFDRKDPRPIGSIRNRDGARSAWYFYRGDSDPVDDAIGDGIQTYQYAVALSNQKANYARRRRFAVRVSITGRPRKHPDLITFEPLKVSEDQSLAKKSGTAALIESILETARGPLTASDIAEQAGGVKENTVTQTMRRHPNQFVQVQKNGIVGGKVQPALWGLRSPKEAHSA